MIIFLDGSGGKLNNLRAAVRDMLNKKYGIEVLHGHNMLMSKNNFEPQLWIQLCMYMICLLLTCS